MQSTYSPCPPTSGKAVPATPLATSMPHSCQHDEEVQLYAFDILALDGEDLRSLPLSMRKTNLARLLARQPAGIFVAPFEQGEIGPDLSHAPQFSIRRKSIGDNERAALVGLQGNLLGKYYISRHQITNRFK